MSQTTACPSCGAPTGTDRFCTGCGRDLMWSSAPPVLGGRAPRQLLIVGALGVYAVGQVLQIIEAVHRLGLLDGAPTYVHAIAWLELGFAAFWMGGVIGTAAGMLVSGQRRGSLLLTAVLSVAVAQSLDLTAVIIEAVHVTNAAPSGHVSSTVASALATEWLLVVAISVYLLSFLVAAVAFAGRDWAAGRGRRRRLLSVAFAIWACAAVVAIAAHFVLLLGTPVAGVTRTASIEELVSGVLILLAAAVAAAAFWFAIASAGRPGRVDAALTGAAGALVGVYVLTAVEYFTIGGHVPIDRVKTLYELHAWGGVVFAVAAVVLGAAMALSLRTDASD